MGWFFSLNEFPLNEVFDSFLSRPRDRGIHLYAIVLEEPKGPSPDATDDQSLDAERFKNADEGDVAVLAIVMNLLFDDFSILDFDDFEIGSLAKVLEDFAVLISDCNFHFFFLLK